MTEAIDIAGGLRVPRQVPLDVKAFCLSESVLSNLGASDNLAFTYYEGLVVFCNQEKSKWVWREAQIGEVGLVVSNFVYPAGWISYGINYSLKNFNFFQVFESDKNYLHTQGTPSTVWTIAHGLAKYPSVVVIDSGGTVMEGAINYIDTNNLTITFSAGFSGTATIN